LQQDGQHAQAQTVLNGLLGTPADRSVTGMRSKLIATTPGNTEGTVKNHLSGIFRTLYSINRAQVRSAVAPRQQTRHAN
jgi:hypothetical protein